VPHSHTHRPPLTVVPEPLTSADSRPSEREGANGAAGREPAADSADGTSGIAAPDDAAETRHSVVEPRDDVDLEELRTATGMLLNALHVVDGSGRKAARMAGALVRMVVREPLTIDAVPNDGGCQDLVVCKGITFRALCDDHLMPLSGVVHVGYVPDQLLLPASGAADVIGHFARQPQSPPQLASQAVQWIERELQPLGAGVIVHADHSCDSALGTNDAVATVCSSLVGQLRESALLRAHFMAVTSSR
jgi:GTP cyclohydrolase IA